MSKKIAIIVSIIILLSAVIVYFIGFSDSNDSFGIKRNKIIKIGELRSNHLLFDSEVNLEGYVTKVIDIPFLSDDFYKITDGTGEIWILSNRASLQDVHL